MGAASGDGGPGEQDRAHISLLWFQHGSSRQVPHRRVASAGDGGGAARHSAVGGGVCGERRRDARARWGRQRRRRRIHRRRRAGGRRGRRRRRLWRRRRQRRRQRRLRSVAAAVAAAAAAAAAVAAARVAKRRSVACEADGVTDGCVSAHAGSGVETRTQMRVWRAATTSGRKQTRRSESGRRAECGGYYMRIVEKAWRHRANIHISEVCGETYAVQQL